MKYRMSLYTTITLTAIYIHTTSCCFDWTRASTTIARRGRSVLMILRFQIRSLHALSLDGAASFATVYHALCIITFLSIRCVNCIEDTDTVLSLRMLFTQRHSVAKSVGCFQWRLFVCLFDNTITSERVNIGSHIGLLTFGSQRLDWNIQTFIHIGPTCTYR